MQSEKLEWLWVWALGEEELCPGLDISGWPTLPLATCKIELLRQGTEWQIQPNLWLLPEKGEVCGEGLVPRCASGLLQCSPAGRVWRRRPHNVHTHMTCPHAHTCTHMHTRIHVCTRHVHIHRHACAHAYPGTCVYTDTRTQRDTRGYTQVHTYTCTQVHVCAHEHVCTHMHTQIRMAAPRLWLVVSSLTALAQPPAGSPRQCTDAGWRHVWELTRDQLFQKVRVKFPCLEDCLLFF